MEMDWSRKLQSSQLANQLDLVLILINLAKETS